MSGDPQFKFSIHDSSNTISHKLLLLFVDPAFNFILPRLKLHLVRNAVDGIDGRCQATFTGVGHNNPKGAVHYRESPLLVSLQRVGHAAALADEVVPDPLGRQPVVPQGVVVAGFDGAGDGASLGGRELQGVAGLLGGQGVAQATVDDDGFVDHARARFVIYTFGNKLLQVVFRRGLLFVDLKLSEDAPKEIV